MATLDRVFFWVVRIVYGARDFVAFRSHPHIGYRSQFTASERGAFVEQAECWCGARCAVVISRETPLPVALPRSAEWSLPPVAGWPPE